MYLRLHPAPGKLWISSTRNTSPISRNMSGTAELLRLGLEDLYCSEKTKETVSKTVVQVYRFTCIICVTLDVFLLQEINKPRIIPFTSETKLSRNSEQ